MNNDFFHTTKDGTKMAICQMEDGHLLNTINMFLRNMAEAKEYLANSTTTDLITEIIFQQDRKAMEVRSRHFLERAMSFLPRYVFEACVRGLLDAQLVERIQIAVGRKSMVASLKMLSAFDSIDDDDDFDY